MPKYEIDVSLRFSTTIAAKSKEEALDKAEKLYKEGRGRLPREYICVSDHYDFMEDFEYNG